MGGGLYTYDEEIGGVPVWFLQDDYGEMTIGYGFVGDFLFFGSSTDIVRLAVEGRDSPLSDNTLFKTATEPLQRNLRGRVYVDVEQGLTNVYRAMDDFDKEAFNTDVRPYVDSIRAVAIGTKPMNDKGVLEGSLFVCTE
jgi:hypothetical protein